MKMPRVRIDDKEVEVKEGTNLILAGLKAGVYIPHYCWHPLLRPVAQCRMCLVEIEGIPKLQPACMMSVTKDMTVRTNTPRVKNARRIVLELLLQHHPVDCPVCPRSGECDLQNFTWHWGPETKRYDGERRKKGWVRVSERILLFKERCVLCTRCVRYTHEFLKTDGITVSRRGFYSDLVIFPEKFVDTNYAGNIIDLCPVGALVDEATCWMPRSWRVRRALTHCPLCERGCQVVVEAWENTVSRVKTFDTMLDKADPSLYKRGEQVAPVYPEIKGAEDEIDLEKLYEHENLIICDIGRWDWREVFLKNRITAFLRLWVIDGKLKEQELDWDSFSETVKRYFEDSESKAILVTPFATVEEAESFSNLAKTWGADISLLPWVEGEDDGILLMKVRAPNVRGCERYFKLDREVLGKVEGGKYDLVVAYTMGANPDFFDHIRAKYLVLVDVRVSVPPGNTRELVFFPATIPYEKDGTYVFAGGEKRIRSVYEVSRPTERDLVEFLMTLV